MRTTVSINDDLLHDAKTLAVQSGKSLGAILEDGLRVLLARQAKSREQEEEFHLPTDSGGGLQFGVDLDDKEAMAALFGEDAPFSDDHR
ncbi:type II toxin-antitoxin system CcdA family antitoxin [Amycolatopsis sp. GM8]|uniref:type II toxin-antitoxin system CcdA family antitoxin n=1 Tax=Amycolatopsis sp. GM8 TaxID=2896530 RepID=UPI001F4557CE|nr:type II toxin-antitoxin system CcdA family antitoxin [Amycolatopsis sp. GM8]